MGAIIVGGLDLVTCGFAESLSEQLMNDAKETVKKALEGEVHERVNDWGSVKEHMRKSLQKFFSAKSNRRPMILPVIMEI